MQLQIGLVNSNSQFILGTFSSEALPEYKVLGLETLEETSLDCLFLDDTEHVELKELISSPRTTYPIRQVDKSILSRGIFEKWDYSTASDTFNKYRDSWVLKNNLSLLEELFPTIEHLQALWPNDRTAFFEELWSIFRFNLNSKKLTIIFNDIKKAVKEHEKNKLIQAKIEGTITPNPVEAGEFEAQAMKHYQDIITKEFEIISFDKKKGEIVITAKINKSPVLIFAEIFNITKLQETLLSTLVSGLQMKK